MNNVTRESRPAVSIIIVSWNTRELLRECLESIENAQLRISNEIIVVDNASDDFSQEMTRRDFPRVILIENRENIGFGKACNIAMRQAQGEYLLLLNSDTTIGKDVVEELVRFVNDHPDCGIAGPQLINVDGTVQPSVRNLPTIWRAITEYWLGRRGSYDFYVPAGNSPTEVESVSGAVMVVSKKAVEHVGMFDPRYFLYFEDLDWCRRMRGAGYKIYYLPTATVVHHVGASGRTLGRKTFELSLKSSRIYHGRLEAFVIYAILRLFGIWRRLFG